jgi:hypothetical protein
MFRLLDQNKDSLINFKEFVTGMSECLQGLPVQALPTFPREALQMPTRGSAPV